MAERSATAPYQPYSDVTSQGGGGEPFRVESNPNQFGAQIGGALQNTGEEGQKVGNQAIDLAIKQQGMINETLATNAETQYMAKLGELSGSYHSLSGLDAVSARQKYVDDVADLRQQFRTSLPMGAAHAFDMLAVRHEGYALMDANTYAATQIRKADYTSSAVGIATSVTSAGSLPIAASDQRFGETLGDIKAHTARQFTDSPGIIQDPETGVMRFDESSPEGKQAKADFTQRLQQETGQAWQNRFNALSDVDPISAFKKYQQERNNIPPETQLKLDASFAPKVANAEALGTSSSVLTQAATEHRDMLLNPQKNNVDISDAIHQQESGGKPHDYQIQRGTFAQYAKPGESFNNPADQDAVYGRIISDLKTSYPNDPARQAVAYFSGKGNVAPAGSATPWINDNQDKNGKTVSSYVADITNKTSGTVQKVTTENAAFNTTQKTPPLSQADYFRINYSSILDNAAKAAEAQHPGDAEFAERVRAKTETRMNDIIRQQEMSYKVDNDIVMQAFNGDFSKGFRPTSVEQLVGSNPKVKEAWDRMTVNQPQAASLIENRILTANSKQSDKDIREYGGGFYDLFKAVHAPANDPNRITSPTQLYSHIGENGDLTMSGLDKLTKELESKKTPEGEAEGIMKTQNLKVMKSMLSGEDQIPGLKDPKGEQIYAQGLPLFFKAVEEGKTKGIPISELYDPSSKNWAGNAVKGLIRSPSEYYTNLQAANLSEEDHKENSLPSGIFPGFQTLFNHIGGQTSQNEKSFINDFNIKKLPPSDGISALTQAVKNKTISQQTANQLALSHGYYRAKNNEQPVEVPKPDLTE